MVLLLGLYAGEMKIRVVKRLYKHVESSCVLDGPRLGTWTSPERRVDKRMVCITATEQRPRAQTPWASSPDAGRRKKASPSRRLPPGPAAPPVTRPRFFGLLFLFFLANYFRLSSLSDLIQYFLLQPPSQLITVLPISLRKLKHLEEKFNPVPTPDFQSP